MADFGAWVSTWRAASSEAHTRTAQPARRQPRRAARHSSTDNPNADRELRELRRTYTKRVPIEATTVLLTRAQLTIQHRPGARGDCLKGPTSCSSRTLDCPFTRCIIMTDSPRFSKKKKMQCGCRCNAWFSAPSTFEVAWFRAPSNFEGGVMPFDFLRRWVSAPSNSLRGPCFVRLEFWGCVVFRAPSNFWGGVVRAPSTFWRCARFVRLSNFWKGERGFPCAFELLKGGVVSCAFDFEGACFVRLRTL